MKKFVSILLLGVMILSILKIDAYADDDDYPSFCPINELGSIGVKGYSNSTTFVFPYAEYPGYL